MITTNDTTIGMKLDAFIAFISEIPLSYQLFLALCLLFSCSVLNIATDRSTTACYQKELLQRQQQQQQQQKRQAVSHPTVTKPSSSTTHRSSTTPRNEVLPEPKWHILKLLNICAVIGFGTSIGYFVLDASTFLNDSGSLLKFLACWSVFLCYFIGFFGISFIDDEVLIPNEEPPRQEQSSRLSTVEPVLTKNHTMDVTKKMAPTTTTTTPLHPPANSTPVCTDPQPSLSKPSSSTQPHLPPPESTPDQTYADMVLTNQIKDHQLEKILGPRRAVTVRRLIFRTKLSTLPYTTQQPQSQESPLTDLPHEHSLDYSRVHGANCETVVGYVPLPVGMVGPLTLNHQTVYFPMATTEGCLVASANRGAKAISQGSGAISTITRDGITRAPCLRMESATQAAELKLWVETEENFRLMKEAFESTTSFGKLKSAVVMVAGRNAYVRLVCFSGDAMGMNMVSKGSLAVIDLLRVYFPELVLVALSGNVCTDKKASAINWIEGRGKSVVVEATIPKDVVRTTLKTDVKTIVRVNNDKNLIGSALAGSIGGFNAHAANIVTAIFIATGQDPAQNVESSNCMTLMEETEKGDLWISCTMPSIEVGTVGGGTGLAAQRACLKIIGCQGGGVTPGSNSRQLAHVVAAGTMAGELSLMAALAANTLVQAHMQHNRKPVASNVVKSP